MYGSGVLIGMLHMVVMLRPIPMVSHLAIIACVVVAVVNLMRGVAVLRFVASSRQTAGIMI